MALSNTLFAGLSGLNVNQVKLNVVANNIANVNTVAFKIISLTQLVPNGGEIVQGFGVDKAFKVISGNLTSVVIPLGAATTASATNNVTFEGNLNAGGDVAAGASILTSQLLTTVGV